MGKASAQALKPDQIEAMARQQNFMNNPNQNNYFGSTRTTFDGNDQATIDQTLNPRIEGILDNQMSFAEQGPAQMGNFSMPFLEGLLQNTVNSLGRTGGWDSIPQVGGGGMGGYDGQQPQFGQQQQPEQPAAPNPELSFGIPPTGPTGDMNPHGGPQGYTREPKQGQPDPNSLAQALTQFSQQGGAGGGGGQQPFKEMGNEIGNLIKRVKQG